MPRAARTRSKEAKALKYASLVTVARLNFYRAAEDVLPPTTDVLEIAVREYNFLRNAKILRMSQLVCMSEAELLKIRGVGCRTVENIKTALAQFGLCLDWDDSVGRAARWDKYPRNPVASPHV